MTSTSPSPPSHATYLTWQRAGRHVARRSLGRLGSFRRESERRSPTCLFEPPVRNDVRGGPATASSTGDCYERHPQLVDDSIEAISRALAGTGEPAGDVGADSTDQRPPSPFHYSPAVSADAVAPVISTVVLSWNRADLLERTVTSYLTTVTVPYELVIVDNGSTDGAAELVRDLSIRYPVIKTILLSTNEGGEAINRGLEWSRGRLLHISENDIDYLPGWDTAVLEAFAAFPSLGQLSLFGPVPTDDEIWEMTPSVLRHAAGRIVYETTVNVGTTSVLRRELWDQGLRVSTIETGSSGSVKLPDDAALSRSVRQLGYMSAFAERYLVRNMGHEGAEFERRPTYYAENYRHKPWVGEDGWRDRIRKHEKRARPQRTSFLFSDETFSAEKSSPSPSCPEPYLWSMIDGWTAEVETLEFLYGLVRLVKPLRALETGTWHGRAARAIGRALMVNGRGRLVTLEVDCESHAIAAEHVAQSGLSDVVEVLNVSSLEYVPPEPVDFLLLDSDLSIRGAEFEWFRPYLLDGALVLFHDTSPSHGVVLDAVRDLVARGLLTAIHLQTPRGLSVCHYAAGPARALRDSEDQRTEAIP